ncbi:hypothetical protein TTHERM_02482160 (macronuclear) [Tetrahymena thermophila SB210]|uniref:Transmembrane protein n=1 Tax=Tetrahymena thermophila (strain SB210) TaxID=312017 RepID=Q224H7_TETTS|nr:hypothetical protein TTHERM_02482160 [Tetrahymena thermophila SB210]EAR80693.2 hypothetical protein TTHERM_02482160 [Tetrahymena thermophila SB210]|eukprot:XP_001028356.2 hypothetical protein TTHERM_02482160 [Tetrahymena thermophila SB210]
MTYYMMIKYITIKVILLLVIQLKAKELCTEIEGCISCINNANNQNQCTQCDMDYQLDSEQNLCIYIKCNNYQFFDKQQYDGSQESGCVAICNSSTQQDDKTNLCKTQLRCNTQRPSQQIMQEKVITKDFFIYQDDYYVAQKEGSLFIYNRTDVSLIKNIFHKRS